MNRVDLCRAALSDLESLQYDLCEMSPFAAVGRWIVQEREALRRASRRKLAAIEGEDAAVLQSILAAADKIAATEGCT